MEKMVNLIYKNRPWGELAFRRESANSWFTQILSPVPAILFLLQLLMEAWADSQQPGQISSLIVGNSSLIPH